MKALLPLFFVLICSFTWSQSIIDSGVRNYNQKNYREALKNLYEAEQMAAVFTEEAIAKLRFYKSQTLWKLNSSENDLIEDLVRDIVEGLRHASATNADWSLLANETYSEMRNVLTNQAERINKAANKQKELDEKIRLKRTYVAKLELVEYIQPSASNELIIAETLHEIGDLYFEAEGEALVMNLASEYYSKALKAYELARYNDPYSKPLIKAVLKIARRTGDAERVKEYTKLLELAGG